jgi:hypothetical protein
MIPFPLTIFNMIFLILHGHRLITASQTKETELHVIDFQNGKVWSKKTKKWIKGCVNNKGYIQLDFSQDGKRQRPLLHRFLYEHYHNCKLTENDQIDHINGNKQDNNISNLRKVNNSQNNQNKSKRRDSKQPFKGIFKTEKGFTASITANGKKQYLGSFKNAKDAYQAYKNEALKLNKKKQCTFQV